MDTLEFLESRQRSERKELQAKVTALKKTVNGDKKKKKVVMCGYVIMIVYFYIYMHSLLCIQSPIPDLFIRRN